jgi:hypothetical protein
MKNIGLSRLGDTSGCVVSSLADLPHCFRNLLNREQRRCLQQRTPALDMASGTQMTPARISGDLYTFFSSFPSKLY